MTDKEVAKHIGEFLGAEIEHVQMGYHDYKAYMLKSGHPNWFVRDAAEFERIKATGIDEKPSSYSKDVEKLIGRKPETFGEYFNNKDAMTVAWKWPVDKK